MSIQEPTLINLSSMPRVADKVGMPSHRWYAHLTDTGDASGGFVQLYTAFESSQMQNYWFNLMGLYVACTSNMFYIVYCQPKEFAESTFYVGASGTCTRLVDTTYYADAGYIENQLQQLRQPFRPKKGNNLNYVCLWDDNINTIVYTCDMWGYVWSPESMKAGIPVLP